MDHLAILIIYIDGSNFTEFKSTMNNIYVIITFTMPETASVRLDVCQRTRNSVTSKANAIRAPEITKIDTSK